MVVKNGDDSDPDEGGISEVLRQLAFHWPLYYFQFTNTVDPKGILYPKIRLNTAHSGQLFAVFLSTFG